MAADTPECMMTIVEELEDRFQFVVTLMRQMPDSIDDEQQKGAFAFVIGTDSDNCLIIEGSTSGDGAEATATIWSVQGGKREALSMLEYDGQILLSMPLPT